MSEIRCDKHGMQARTLACQHIAYGLVHKERVGFFWTRDDFSAASGRVVRGMRGPPTCLRG